jgi:hypothetical protein
MKDHTNLILRGHMWWWRKKVRIASKSVPLAFSLQTPDIKRARLLRDRLNARCSELVMAYGVMPSMITEEQAKSVFMDAMRWQLQRILKDTPRDGGDMQVHLYANEVFGVIHQIMANGVPLTKAGDALAMESQRRGWPQDTYDYAYHEFNRLVASPDVSEGQLDQYSRTFGIKRTTTNDDRMITEIRAARSRACFRVNEMLRDGLWTRDQWVEEAMAAPEQRFAFENDMSGESGPSVAAVVDIDRPDPGTPPASSPASTPAPPAGRPETVAAPADQSASLTIAPDQLGADDETENRSIRWTAELMMTAVIERKTIKNPTEKSKGWDRKSCSQALQTAKLFDVIVDKQLSEVEDADVDFFVDALRFLPIPYNLSREDHVAYLRHMADSLRRHEKPQPAGFGKSVGLSDTTIKRHLTFLGTMFAKSNIKKVTAKPISVSDVRKTLPAGEKGVIGRPNDSSHMAKLFRLPIYTGSQPHDGSPGAVSIERRFTPGEFVCHDAWYWVPLLLHYTGMRREEVCKLMVEDVSDDPIPHIIVRFTSTGRVKSESSVRNLALHSELARLGFMAFVTACRAAGWTMLFPELKRSADSTDYGDAFFDRIWNNIRKRGGFPKDFHPHGERHGFSTELRVKRVGLEDRAMVCGHLTGVTTADVYTEEERIEMSYDIISKLESITDHLLPFPINLNPTELRKSRESNGR